jgi:phosphatidylserine decarboxylase
MLDPHTRDLIENVIKRNIRDVKDHICYGVETESQLMYARGRLSALETLLQDIKNLQKEDNDGTIDKT